MLYVFRHNKICQNCDNRLMGDVLILEENGLKFYLWGCREKTCEHVEKDKPTAWVTEKNELIIARKIKET